MHERCCEEINCPFGRQYCSCRDEEALLRERSLYCAKVIQKPSNCSPGKPPKCELAAVAPVLNRVLESTGVTHKNRPNFDAVVFVCGSLGKKQESENESCCQDFFTDSLCWALFKRGIYVIIYLLLYNNYIVIIVVFAHSNC